jgi:hypothetical protein
MARQHLLEVASFKSSKTQQKIIKSLNSQPERLQSFQKKMAQAVS